MTRTGIPRAGLAALSLLILAGLAVASIAWAGSSDGMAVDWSVLSGGGAPASGGSVTLNGTLGQTAIGWSAATHGSLGAGFWYGAGEGMYTVYLPILLRNH